MRRHHAVTPADLGTGPLGCTSLPVQNGIHRSGLVISRPWLQGRIWPPIRQRGCRSGGPRPPSGHWPHEGRRAYRLGRPLLFSATGAVWESEELQNQQRSLLEATAHFDLPASRPGSKGKKGHWPLGDSEESSKGWEHVAHFKHMIYCRMLSEIHFDSHWLENPKLCWLGRIPHY